ncbi:MAG: CHRD domain-containing protein [Hellea sp.]
MANTIDTQNSKKKRMAAKAALAAAIGAAALSTEASAADAEAQMVDVASLNNVVSTRRLEDGSLEIVLENGEVVKLGSDSFVEKAGQFLLTPDALTEFTDGNGFLIVGAIAAAAIGIALISSGGDDAVVAPPPVVIDPNVPTAGNDIIEGSANADTIDGLAGDDTIDGLAGNDTLSGSSGNDTLRGGAGDDTLLGGGGTDVIEGGDGIDTNDFSDIGAGVTATVNADGTGTADYGQVTESFTGIENLTGTAQDDVLTATGAAANVISGGDGDDVIAGGGGVDVLDGGEGNDTNSFVGIGADVTASLVDQTASYGMVNETFTNFENLTGGSGNDILTGDMNANILDGADGNDTLIGGGGADTLTGGAGNDVLAGGGGVDILDGGEGIDTNSFQGIGLGVTANLGGGTASYGMVEETFTNFENLLGSDNDDSLRGDAGENRLEGAAGDDTLIWSGGNDILDGGEGFDTADYTTSSVPITVDLDENGNGTVTRDVGFSVEVRSAEVADDMAFVAAAEAGNLYFNVHTEEFNGGEIRGQLTVSSDETVDGVRTIVLDGALDSAQEPMNASDSDATGTGQVTITVDADGNATYSSTVDISGISPSELITLGNGALSAIHLHNAPAGANGPVLQDVIVDAGGDVEGNSGFTTTVDMAEVTDDVAFIAAADAGNLYFNVHTADFPGGEIRGQLDTVVSDETVDGVRTLVLSASLDADQEPMEASNSNATGSATVTIIIDTDGNATYSSDLAIEGINVDDLITLGDGALSAIHLHNAPAGSNGGVLQDVIVDARGTTTDFSVLVETDVVAEVTEVDQLISIENVVLSDNGDVLNPAAGNQSVDGGAGNDTLFGGSGNDILSGGAGDDLIAGGGGTDVLDGGEGNDTNSFEGIGVNVDANLATGTASYVTPSGVIIEESFSNFENLEGFTGNDTLTGDSNDNTLSGGAGDDQLSGGAGNDELIGGSGNDTLAGGGGQDSLDGGEGIDTADHSDIGIGVTVNLEEGTAEYGMVSETLTSIENVTGTAQDDVLIGDDGDNVLIGGAGDDVLTGDSYGDDDVITISVTNTLGEGGTFLTPVFFGFHDGANFDLYDRGGAVSEGLERLAEDGNIAVLASEFAAQTGAAGVQGVIAGREQGPPPIDPGETGMFTISVNPDDVGQGFFTWATMVIPSNDAFLASPGNPLTDPIFSSDGSFLGPIEILRFGTDVLDAGTEVNTELDAAFLNQTGPNTGVTENGVVTVHQGFNGSEGNPDGSPVNIFSGTTAAGTVTTVAGGDFTANGGSGQLLRILIDRADITSNDILDGGAGNDTIDGGTGNDLLIGGSGNDVLIGGSGDDVLRGGSGQDNLDGGRGIDTADHSDIGVGVTVNLGAGTATYGAVHETLANIENVIGSAQDDTIRGDGGVNVIEAGAGDDTITWTGGEDTYNGGEGNDTVDYTSSSVPVIVELDADGNGTATRELGFSVEVTDADVSNDATFVQSALDGNLYFNVHTSEFNSGEIRGQLTVSSDELVDGVRTIVLDGSLDGAQEPMNASESDATGTGQVTITVDADGNATYSSSVDISGISTSELITLGNGALSAIHLHNAPAGQNGPVLQDIIVDAGGDVTGLALSEEADSGDGNVFDEVVEVDTLISIETVIGQNGAPITTAAESVQESSALKSAEVEDAPIFEVPEIVVEFDFAAEFSNNIGFDEDGYAGFIPDMFEVA